MEKPRILAFFKLLAQETEEPGIESAGLYPLGTNRCNEAKLSQFTDNSVECLHEKNVFSLNLIILQKHMFSFVDHTK